MRLQPMQGFPIDIGLVNPVEGEMKGIQIGGINMIGGKVTGLQIGLWNET